MCDYESSSQLKSWLYTPNQLEKCRERVNRQARAFLVAQQQQQHDNNNNNNNDHHHQSMSDIGDTPKPPSSSPPPVYSFAANFAHRNETMQEDDDDGLLTSTTTANDDDHFLTPHEEGLLVAFYASKLPSLIGPMAQVPRLRRDVKVAATASLLYHRFYLSNSVMLHDPKTIMVAAAFLGSKVEDAMSDVRNYVTHRQPTKREADFVSCLFCLFCLFVCAHDFFGF
jgi:cyclin H